MANRDYVHAVTEEFGDMLGIQDLRLDAEGNASLSVGALEVSLHLDPNESEILWLSALFGQLADDMKAPEFLLHANFYSWIGDTMTVSLSEGDDDTYLATGFTAIPTSMLTAEALGFVFQKFTTAALAIHARLDARDYSPIDDTLGTTSPELPTGTVFRV